jgi:hypothetical protein
VGCLRVGLAVIAVWIAAAIVRAGLVVVAGLVAASVVEILCGALKWRLLSLRGRAV